MTIHVMHFMAPNGDLVDVDQFCGAICLADALRSRNIEFASLSSGGTYHYGEGLGSISWGAWPCGQETDYNVYCPSCGNLVMKGLQEEEGD